MMQKYLKWFIHDNLCFSQMSQASPLKESFAYFLVSCYFWFMMGKSSWVPFRTQGLFPLVAGCDVSWLLQELDGSCRSGEVWS
jgi:hypothetical protein